MYLPLVLNNGLWTVEMRKGEGEQPFMRRHGRNLLTRVASICESDNDFDEDEDLERPVKDARKASVGTQWRDFFHVEEYD
ncbi:hypothetical protein C0Q70_00805 [Pomacea canaliculata]|uniref:Uncharacterized protein n=1 Tax=Pomacea canaliculata TaxID=400727 RepID=A0A2T7PXP6_POMCA|nr:hypothetical protein C0Q70_00805 [Pomacea canaliculata]